MKILIIHQIFISPREAGGTRHFEFARYMVQKGHQAVIIASKVSYLTGKHVVSGRKFIQEEWIDGVQVLRVSTVPSIHKSYVWRIIAFMSFMLTSLIASFMIRDVDLVMGTTPPIFQACSAWISALTHRCPFLLEVRDLWPDFAIDIGILRDPLLIRIARWIECFLYHHSTHIVVNSPAYRNHIVNKSISDGKITLISNGTDTRMFDPHADGRDIREQLGLQGKFIITYAGALGMANDIDTILRAANCLRNERNIHFLIVGDGKERQRLVEKAEGWGLTNVTFTGFYPKAAMKEVLAASDACVATLMNIPMFRTTYPNKVFDYMAAGRPIVLGIDGVIRNVVEEARAGMYVPPGDDMAMASVVLRFFHEPENASSMGNAGRAYVERYFDRAGQARDFLLLAQGLTHGPNA